MAKRYRKEELTCPECGWVAKNANGLRGHRQFKHGVLPSKQMQLFEKREQRDRLVSFSELEQRLSELERKLGFADISQLSGLEQLLSARPITDLVQQLNKRVATLEQDKNITPTVAAELKAQLATVAKQASADTTMAAQGIGLLSCIIDTHQHDEAGNLVLADAWLAKEWQPVHRFVESEVAKHRLSELEIYIRGIEAKKGKG